MCCNNSKRKRGNAYQKIGNGCISGIFVCCFANIWMMTMIIIRYNVCANKYTSTYMYIVQLHEATICKFTSDHQFTQSTHTQVVEHRIYGWKYICRSWKSSRRWDKKTMSLALTILFLLIFHGKFWWLNGNQWPKSAIIMKKKISYRISLGEVLEVSGRARIWLVVGHAKIKKTACCSRLPDPHEAACV